MSQALAILPFSDAARNSKGHQRVCIEIPPSNTTTVLIVECREFKRLKANRSEVKARKVREADQPKD